MNINQLSLFDDVPAQEYDTAEGDEYAAFVKKFKPKKTTDDCYTPPEVYDAVVGWLRSEGLIDDTTPIVRPFYPGGDYQRAAYPPGCVVVDNPPFSIYAQIVRWYLAHGIRFMLFGPQLTLSVFGADACFMPISANITYENSAVVNTGFVTNLIPGVRLWTAPTLRAAIMAVVPTPRTITKNTYPDNVITCANAGKIASRGVDLRINADECRCVHNVDMLKAAGRKLFGDGWILSTNAAAERAAAERAAAERAVSTTVQLSEREWAIVAELDKK